MSTTRPVLSPWRAASEGTWSRAVHRRRGRIALPSLSAGLLIALSLPPWGWWPLAFLGAALLFLRLRGLPLRTRILAGWLAGLGCFVPGLWWAAAFNWYGAVVLMVVEALSMAGAAALVPPDRGRVTAFVGSFTLLEALRMAWPLGGLPLGGAFLGQAGGPLLGVARLGGPLLLTAVVWLGGAGLGQLVLLAYRWYRGDWASSGDFAAALVPLVILVVLGIGAALAPDGGPSTQRVSVAAVQGGGRRGTSASEVRPSTVFDAQEAASSTLEVDPPAGGSPRLVVWPEDVVALSTPLHGSRQAAALSTLARRLRATVVAGVTVDVSDARFLNEAVAWGPNGQVVGSYEKVHRVPFGEYVPWRGFFSGLANLSAVPRDAVAGHGTGMVETPAGRLGLMLSYEVFFADRGSSAVDAGAQLLVVPTNTSSYGTSQVPSQEVAADRVQAVENGRDLVQAAPTGFSTLVTPSGDVLERSQLGARGVLVGALGLRDGRTVYGTLGDLPLLVLAALALVAGWFRSLRPRRPRW